MEITDLQVGMEAHSLINVSCEIRGGYRKYHVQSYNGVGGSKIKKNQSRDLWTAPTTFPQICLLKRWSFEQSVQN